ncbi:MAG: N-acetyltransferase [Planctomycetota bacterium]|nr:MAG: N-acetyltransferase [Planctomycetota bacterium]
MPIRIESAQATDYLKVAALDRLAWPIVPDVFIPDGEHIWRVWSDTATLLVARRTDEPPLPESYDIAGALVQFPTKRGELFLHKIIVHPNCRGTGIGTELMKAALAQAEVPVLLTVDPSNAPAVKLYQSLGFTIREHIRGFYRPHEDRYLMSYRPT